MPSQSGLSLSPPGLMRPSYRAPLGFTAKTYPDRPSRNGPKTTRTWSSDVSGASRRTLKLTIPCGLWIFADDADDDRLGVCEHAHDGARSRGAPSTGSAWRKFSTRSADVQAGSFSSPSIVMFPVSGVARNRGESVGWAIAFRRRAEQYRGDNRRTDPVLSHHFRGSASSSSTSAITRRRMALKVNWVSRSQSGLWSPLVFHRCRAARSDLLPSEGPKTSIKSPTRAPRPTLTHSAAPSFTRITNVRSVVVTTLVGGTSNEACGRRTGQDTSEYMPGASLRSGFFTSSSTGIVRVLGSRSWPPG